MSHAESLWRNIIPRIWWCCYPCNPCLAIWPASTAFSLDFFKTVIVLACKSFLQLPSTALSGITHLSGCQAVLWKPFRSAHELSMSKEVERNRGCHSGLGGSSRLHYTDLPWLWMVQSTGPVWVVMMLDRKLSVTNDFLGSVLIWGESCSHVPCVRKEVDYKGQM